VGESVIKSKCYLQADKGPQVQDAMLLYIYIENVSCVTDALARNNLEIGGEVRIPGS